MENPVIIFGAGALGRAAKEIFETNGVVVYGFLDDDKRLHNTEVDEIMVLGETTDETFLNLIGKKCEAFIALDDNRVRKSIVKAINEARKKQPVNAIHARSHISAKAILGHGNHVDVDVVISPGAIIGSHNILHPRTTIGVQAQIGNFVQLGVGCIVSPDVVIEDDVFVGSGVTIVSGVKVGKGARIGAGSVVVNSIEPGETVFGNPAQKIKP